MSSSTSDMGNAATPGLCNVCSTPIDAAALADGKIDAAGKDKPICTRCAMVLASGENHRIELCISDDLAGVSDRGPSHHGNEDCLALAETPFAEVLVVCDGVSNTQQAALAARVAANSACQSLVHSLSESGHAGSPRDPYAAMVKAIADADNAVRSLPGVAIYSGPPPQSTIVAAACYGSNILLGWVGDSRAYWVDYRGIWQLTKDHSWLNQVVDSGEMTRDQALRMPKSHMITRSLGTLADDARAHQPAIIEYDIDSDLSWPGRLILCTDGFWDCAADETTFKSLVLDWIGQTKSGTDALTLARALVENGCRQRGHDNITVATLTFGEQYIEKRNFGT